MRRCLKIRHSPKTVVTKKSLVNRGVELTGQAKYGMQDHAMFQAFPARIKMNRKGFGMRPQVREEVRNTYKSSIIEELRTTGYSKRFGRLTIHLAQEFGFCYGVDRAVELAFETRQKFPDRKIYLTTEIIHNPTVNQNMKDMGISFLSGPFKNASINDVTKNDVVLIPAFGTTVSELKRLCQTGATLVDTICGSVLVVWKRVEKYAWLGFTSVIHGKYYHEETQATSSQVLQCKNGHYLVVLNREEASYVCDYILNGGRKDDFFKKFPHAMSPGFDPDKQLEKIGLANQTTMLSSESLAIGELFKNTLAKKFGKEKSEAHFMSFDTICSATQDRQDAMVALIKSQPHLFLIVGGYNSSNTSNLHRIALDAAPSYHINLAECLIDRGSIRHKPLGQHHEIITGDWLPDGDVSVGITAGASTPNRVMGDVLERLVSL